MGSQYFHRLEDALRGLGTDPATAGDPIKRAPQVFANDELEVLFATSWLRPAPCMALLAWIEHSADWEVNRRKGFDFHLQPPADAIDPSEYDAAISAAIVLHDEYAGDLAIARFFAAAVDTLIDRGRCQ